MHEPPSAANLLATVRHTLQTEILAHLPPESRVSGLMVLRALAIAERAISADPDWPAPLLARARALTGAATPLHDLATAIRAGHYDPGLPNEDAVETLLWDIARRRCDISNPKAASPKAASP